LTDKDIPISDNKKMLIVLVLLVLFVLCAIIKPLRFLPDPEGDAERATLQSGREALLADFRSTNEASRVAAVEVLHQDKSLWPELIQGLQEDGTPDLALAFCRTYEPELRDAAVMWADEHGYRIMSISRGMDNWFTIEPKPKK
jgi:hypothetical protein